jgi:hypothetical protein
MRSADGRRRAPGLLHCGILRPSIASWGAPWVNAEKSRARRAKSWRGASARALPPPTSTTRAASASSPTSPARKSHSIVEQGLKVLENLTHRGAVGADPLMGDGAGILIQIPDELYRAEMAAPGVDAAGAGEYGVGMVFLPKEHASRLACEQELERAVRAEGQVLLGWRDVPVDREMPMSPTVRAKEPVIRQIFIGRGPDVIVPTRSSASST